MYFINKSVVTIYTYFIYVETTVAYAFYELLSRFDCKRFVKLSRWQHQCSSNRDRLCIPEFVINKFAGENKTLVNQKCVSQYI